jgi:hypothetical protein
VLWARARDAADVALTTTFGLSQLDEFTVWADELPAGERGPSACDGR